MLASKVQLRSFITFAILISVLAFFVFQAYLSAVFLAVVFVIAFMPVHRFTLSLLGKRESISAFISTFIVLLVIFVPITFFSTLLFQEARLIYEEGLENSLAISSIEGVMSNIEEKISNIYPGLDVEIRQYTDVENIIKQGPGLIVDYFNRIFAGLIRLAIGLLLMVLALFYIFRDGDKALVEIRRLSPLKREYTDKILFKIADSVNAVVRGRLLVGLIQGFVIGIGFFLFNLPSPVFWGFVSAVVSMLPVVGPLMIIIPTALILFFTGSVWSALGILAWGIIAVIVIDEYLGAILINQRMNVHPFLILVSVMGGITFFGPIGFVVGPVVLALLFAILEIYSLIILPEAYENKKIQN